MLTQYVILDGEYEATKVRRMDFLSDEDPERQAAKQESFAKAMDGLGYNVESLELAEVPDLVADLNKDKPYIEVNIVNWQGDKSHGYNCYINRQLSAEEVEELGMNSPDDGSEVKDEAQEVEEQAPARRKPSRRRPAAKKRTAKAGSRK